ncbi:hypothetical protein [Halomonas sp. A29]|uniref:hypothetical protein n=1 Tax=Halomonas sp. A29 TaxID=3102786 RepID=UPI00398B8DEC
MLLPEQYPGSGLAASGGYLGPRQRAQTTCRRRCDPAVPKFGHGIADLVIIDSDTATVKRRINLTAHRTTVDALIVNNKTFSKALFAFIWAKLADGMKEILRETSKVSTIKVS